MAEKAEITFSSGEITQQAVVPGPLYLEISGLYTVQPSGSFKNDNVIKVGEAFDMVMRVSFRDILSDLNVGFVANFHSLNFKTGNLAPGYCFAINGKLPGGGVRSMTLRQKVVAQETGIFLLAGSIGLPQSSLFDFSLGHFAGSEPPHPASPKLKVANFYVFDPANP